MLRRRGVGYPATIEAARILVVEDDEALREAVCEGLRERRYVVTPAASAEEALEHLHVASFDLLITDYRLGGATGTWLARIAARSGQLATPRILLVTAYSNLPDAEGLQVVRKPFDHDAFLAKVEQVLAGPASEAPREPPHPAQRIALTLYVNGSVASARAARKLRDVVGAYRAEQIALTIVDVTKQHDHRAEEDRVLVTPTLIKTFPRPRTWIVGDLERPDVVERVLVQAGVERASGD
jgi:CheY-like chemotaxis protein